MKKLIIGGIGALTFFTLFGCEQNFTDQIEKSGQTQNQTQANFSATNAEISTQQPTAEVINHGPRDEKIVALTFDADMTPKMANDLKTGKVKSLYDQRITDILEKNKVPATMFLTGMWAQIYPDIVKKMAQNPLYEIANHSFDHAAFKMPCYGLAQTIDKQNELAQTQKILKDLTGQTPRFFRFPGGCYGNQDLTLVKNAGLQVVGWDVVSDDAFQKDPAKIENAVLKNTTNGSIIVMHLDGEPNSPATALALQNIIDGLKQKDFAFMTISQLLTKN